MGGGVQTNQKKSWQESPIDPILPTKKKIPTKIMRFLFRGEGDEPSMMLNS